MSLEGVYLPIVTPFLDGEIDWESLRNLISHYAKEGVSGIFAGATTGEGPALEEDEHMSLLEHCLEYAEGLIPVFAGLTDNNTRRLVRKAGRIERLGLSGVLSAVPYYNLPGQRGISEHFRRLSESTSLPVILYNIPARTGRNMENDTVRRLAEEKNIIGLKDSCGDIDQTMELLLDPVPGFSILAGHDAHFFLNLALGGSGGILASAHIHPSRFVKLFELMRHHELTQARGLWTELLRFIPVLFREPNPAPLKYALSSRGFIKSPELRLPLTGISPELAGELDFLFAEKKPGRL